MPEGSKANINGWTVEMLHALVDEKIKRLEHVRDEQDKRYEQRFEAQDATAVKNNQFRQAMEDQARLMLPRAEADRTLSAVNDRLNAIDRFINELRGSTARATIGADRTMWIVGLVVGAMVSGTVLIGEILLRR